MKTLLKIKWEVITGIIMTVLLISLIIVTILYYTNDWQTWLICAFTAIGIFIAYYGIKTGRQMLLEIYGIKK